MRHYQDIFNNKDFFCRQLRHYQRQKLFEVELWNYDLKLISNKKHVDVASLYAAFKQETDERIQQALQEVMSTQIWYTD